MTNFDLDNLPVLLLNDLNDFLIEEEINIEVAFDKGGELLEAPEVTMQVYNQADGLRTASRELFSQNLSITILIYTDGPGRIEKGRNIGNVISKYFRSIGFTRSHFMNIPNYANQNITRYHLRFSGNVTKFGQSY